MKVKEFAEMFEIEIYVYIDKIWTTDVKCEDLSIKLEAIDKISEEIIYKKPFKFNYDYSPTKFSCICTINKGVHLNSKVGDLQAFFPGNIN